MGGLPSQGGGGPRPIRRVKISDQPIDIKIKDQPIDIKIKDQPIDVDIRNGPIDVKLDEPIDVNVLNAINADITDRCARLLGRLCFGGVPIDPRDRNWTLDFVTDQVDASGSSVTVSGTIDANITDRCNRLLGQLCFGGVAIDPRDRNWTLDFATDQVDVSGSVITTTSVPTTPILDYNTGLGIGSGSSSTHTYTATGTFRLSSVQVSASGAMKIEVKAGTSGSEMTKMIAFTTDSNLIAQLNFHEELQLTIGQRVQVIRTNREQQAMDVFSTIIGLNI